MMMVTHIKHHLTGLPSMAYILLFAGAMFCALITAFYVMARNHPVPVEHGEKAAPTLEDPKG